MRNIPTLAYLVVFIDVFFSVLSGVMASNSTLGAWVAGIAIALLLSIPSGEIAFVAAKKSVVIYRWLRSTIKLRKQSR